jgi:hypothetical protein
MTNGRGPCFGAARDCWDLPKEEASKLDPCQKLAWQHDRSLHWLNQLFGLNFWNVNNPLVVAVHMRLI